jgi:hypothetical protein
LLSVAAQSAATHRPRFQEVIPFGRQRFVDIRGDPQRTAADGQCRLGEIGPAGLPAMTLYDGDRTIGTTVGRA